MAKIICRSVERSKLAARSQILFLRRDPRKMHEDEQKFGITSTTLETLVSKSDLLLLCVRPAQAEGVLRELARYDLQRKMLVSILAGATIPYFEKFLGPVPLIRAMPNVASEVGEGMTILTPGPTAGPEFRSLATLLFSSMGATVELPEEFMDISIGMAGSGIAYALLLIEAVARSGEREGIPYEKARKMAAHTFRGAAEVLLKGGAAVEELTREIAVPNGTTEAGLKVMKDLEIEKRLQAVVSAAAERSKAISKEMR